MTRYSFEPLYNGSDWEFSHTLPTSQLTGGQWSAGDVVTVGLNPEGLVFPDDYGLPAHDVYRQFSSAEPGGIVTLVAPRTVRVAVPAARISDFGNGVVNVGFKLVNTITGRTRIFATGRLPVVYSGV